LTGGNEHAADDLVQDTLVLALQAWDRFTPGTNLKAWLFRILRNRHVTVGTRRHVTAEVGVDDLSLHGSVPAVQEGRAELRHFTAAFARLNPRQREVLVLYAVHGLPYEEIAEVTGCAVGSVKSRMNRARVALKAMLLGDERAVTPAADRSAPEAPGRDRSGRAGARPEACGSPARAA
jgi:RNA polymerase sigma-70 factor, ECF subfamily